MTSSIKFALSMLAYMIVPQSEAYPVMTRQKLIQQSRSILHCNNLVYFNNLYYAIEDTWNISGIPADISIHWKSGDVYFTLISDQMKMTIKVLRQSGDIETIKVAGIGQSTAVDNLNDIIYLATDNGIYKFKEESSAVELYTAMGEDVMYIGLSSDGGTLYIATWPQNKVHKITNDGQKQDTFASIPNGHGLTIDTRNNMYFVATKTSYVLKSGDVVPIRINGLPMDKTTGIFVSRSDEVYAMDENSNLYLVDPEIAIAKRLGSFNITGVNTFAMDSADNFYIGIKDSLMKFKSYEHNPCPVYKALNTMSKRHTKKRKNRKTTTTTEDYDESQEE